MVNNSFDDDVNKVVHAIHFPKQQFPRQNSMNYAVSSSFRNSSHKAHCTKDAESSCQYLPIYMSKHTIIPTYLLEYMTIRASKMPPKKTPSATPIATMMRMP